MRKHLRFKVLLVFMLAGLFMGPDLTAAQDMGTRISLDASNKTMDQVLQEIEKKTDLKFVYDPQVTSATRFGSEQFDNAPVREIVTELGFRAQKKGSNIIVSKVQRPGARQDMTITGTVTDSLGESLAGVTIFIKGTNTGTSTDLNGNFVVEAPADAVLIFTYMGFRTKEVPVNGRETLTVVLEASDSALEEVVVVGFGTQKKISLVGAQSAVTSKELQVPVANLSNALAGRLAGVVSVQRTGEPGFDDSDIWIRGISTFSQGLSSPLVLVDGAPREMANVDPEDIESFTVLKDASATAVYGVRGANGVVIINTKKGTPGKPKISFRYYEGVTTFTKLPEFADGPTFMRMSNEAITNRGGQPMYSEEAIRMTEEGTDPDLYPNVDWMAALFNDYGSQRRANLNISGGSDRATYYVGTSFFDEKGLYKTDDLVRYNSNVGYKRYNLTANIMAKPTNTTTVNLGVQGYLANANYPGSGQGTIFSNAYFVTPIIHPVKFSDGKIADVRSGSLQNPYGHLTQTGYANQWRNQLYSNLRVTQDLPFVIEGLSATAMFSFDVYNYTSMRRTRTPDTYLATGRDENGNLTFDQTAIGERFLSFSRNSQGERTIYLEGGLNYERSFGKHDVGGMVLYNQSDMINTQASNFLNSLPYRFLGVSARGTYGYDNRYFLEANFGYNGAENFAPRNRFGFFPSVGLGWVLSEEAFFEPLENAVQILKFRFSHGIVGNSRIDANRRFAYMSTIDSKTGYSFGEDMSNNYGGYDIGEYGVTVQWETSRKTNLGLDLTTFNNALNLQVDFFKEHRDGIFLRRSSVPAHLGLQNMPYGNLGVIDNKGVDGSFTFNKRWDKLSLQLLGNLTFNRNKVIENDEAVPTYPWQEKRNRKVGQRFGYRALGLFESQEQIDNGPLHPGVVRPGDIRFQDINGDGIINSFDEVPIGYGTIPELVYGFGFSLGYKNFTLSTLFQGVGNVDIRMNGEGVMPFQIGMNRGNLLSNIHDRWTIDNPRQDAFYPRLSDGNVNSNYAYSTWWLKNGRYLRLRNLQLTYNLPQNWLERIKAEGASIFLSGYNLMTWSPFDFWDVELGDGRGTRYPNTTSYTIGVNIDF